MSEVCSWCGAAEGEECRPGCACPTCHPAGGMSHQHHHFEPVLRKDGLPDRRFTTSERLVLKDCEDPACPAARHDVDEKEAC